MENILIHNKKKTLTLYYMHKHTYNLRKRISKSKSHSYIHTNNILQTLRKKNTNKYQKKMCVAFIYLTPNAIYFVPNTF